MGGLFSSPKPMVIEAPAPVVQAETVAESTAKAEDAAADATRDARVKAVGRARRGLAGTIATSERGVLDPIPAFATRKTLLGE